jgi:TonB family protein
MLLTLFLLGSSMADSGESDVNKAIPATSGTEAVPLDQPPGNYPPRALDQGVEGWVIVSFVVTPQGTTEDIEVIQSSRTGFFENAAMGAVKKWQYKPATLNGEPVAQAKNTARLTFMIGNFDEGVSRSFYSRFKVAYKALGEEDLEKARKTIDKLDRSSQNLLSELCLLDYLEGLYWQLSGDPETALVHFEKALVIADDAVNKEMYIQMLRNAIQLNVQQMKLAQALAHYDDLVEVDENIEPDDWVNEYVAKVRQFLESDKPYVTAARITQPCPSCETLVPFWRQVLSRDSFTIQAVDGEIDELKLLCGFQHVTVTFEPQMSWSVNKEWGDCALHVMGSEGTTFELVEL